MNYSYCKNEDVYFYIPLLSLLDKVTGWSAERIMKFVASDEFPRPYHCITRDLEEDYVWEKKEVDDFLVNWKKRIRESDPNFQ